MLFKDEAAALAARWRGLRAEDEIEDVAAMTAVAVARVPEVPDEVMKALNSLLRFSNHHRATAMVTVVRYLECLALDREPVQAAKV